MFINQSVYEDNRVKEMSNSESRDKIVREIADKVLDAIKKGGEKPWNKPWDTSKCTHALCYNVVSGKPYRGINQFMLSFTGETEFATFKQWSEEGRKHAISKGEFVMATDKDGKEYKKTTEYYGVQKGETSHVIVYFNLLKIKEEDKYGNEEEKRIPILKWFRVFSRSQTNIPAPVVEISEEDKLKFKENEEKVREQMNSFLGEQNISLGHGGARAFYRYSSDHIQMPDEKAFPSGYNYMPTFFHEIVHSTGHKTRLNRDMSGYFGDDNYAFEELVAEMGAALLCRHFNILPEDPLEDGLENQAAYLTSWFKKIKDDPNCLIRAGSKAQAAIDFILGTKFEDDGDE